MSEMNRLADLPNEKLFAFSGGGHRPLRLRSRRAATMIRARDLSGPAEGL
jgi:hypothetical protein